MTMHYSSAVRNTMLDEIAADFCPDLHLHLAALYGYKTLRFSAGSKHDAPGERQFDHRCAYCQRRSETTYGNCQGCGAPL
jgi:hypothetical protein